MANFKKKIRDIAVILTAERTFYWLIILTMITLPFFEFFAEIHGHSFEGQPMIVEISGIAGFIMASAHMVMNRGEDSKRCFSDIIYVMLLLFATLSLVFTEDMYSSLGGYDYDEWPTHFMAYFSLMYAGTMIKDLKLRRNILKVFIFILIIQGIPGVFQSIGIEIDQSFYDEFNTSKNNWSYGLTQQFNWYSALMTLAGGCAMGLAIFSKEQKDFLKYAVLVAIAAYTMFSNESRLSLLGILSLIMFYPVALIIYNLKNNDKEFFKESIRNWLGVTAIIAEVFVICVFAFGRYENEFRDTMNEINGNLNYNIFYIGSGNESYNDVPDTSVYEKNDDPLVGLPESEKYTLFDTFASGRGHIWKFGLACVPEHWAFGVGLDNYRWCFSHAPDLPHDTWTNGKGHSELIHYLVTQGIFQLLTILTLVVYTLIVGIRNVLTAEDKEERIITFILVGMFSAYFVQSMFNSSVVNIAPYYWITTGLILCRSNQRPLGSKKGASSSEKEVKSSK